MSTVSLSKTTSTTHQLYANTSSILLEHEVLLGCNPYFRSSVVRQSFALGSLSDTTTTLSGKPFAKQFLTRFLDLNSFLLRNGLDKKFIKQLDTQQGVNFPSILLEAILAVEAATAFARHELNAVRYAGIKSFEKRIDIIWASQTPRLSREIAEVALVGLLELLPSEHSSQPLDEKTGFDASLNRLLNKARRTRMAASTAVIKLAATKRRIPCEIVGQQHLVLGQGAKQMHLYASMTSTTPITAQKICIDKRQTNRRLKELRLPVPKHSRVGSVEAAVKAAKAQGVPVIIKPVKGKKGRDISGKITSIGDVTAAFETAHNSGSDVLVEKYIEGDDYRILVIGGKFHSAVKRTPPTIVGDGQSTVSELIEHLNQDPYRDGFRGFPVTIDKEIKSCLIQANVSLEDRLEQGREIVLRLRANVSTGGTPTDVTDLVHPEIRAMAERAAKSVDLSVAGIDYMTTDIELSPEEAQGVIIEINARPGLDIHVWPHTGKSRDAGGCLIEHLFPHGDSGRIPVIASAGDQGTGASARLVDALFRGAGQRVALTLKYESYADGRETQMSKKQQANAPIVMLRDPEIDSLVTTVSLRQTAKRGMLLEQCDVAMIMDRVKPGRVKAFLAGLEVLVQATTRCIVVGAGNLVALQRIERLSKHVKLIVVSAQQNDPALQEHLSAGHIAVTLNWQHDHLSITLMTANNVIASISAAGYGGKSKVINDAILYAVGAAYGAGLSIDEIANAMKLLPELATIPRKHK